MKDVGVNPTTSHMLNKCYSKYILHAYLGIEPGTSHRCLEKWAKLQLPWT